MATTDLSRSAFDPRKHYASVRMQQGRVIVDDDWNENERLENEDRRRTNIDVIGPQGSPDSGFQVQNVRHTGQGLDFDIAAGTMYLGGLRVTMETKEDTDKPETFQLQSDYLQKPLSEGSVPESGRIDLAYLEVWQQPVSAVEDDELIEVALGGPDTSTRLRNMRRVRIAADVGSQDCAAAWQAVASRLTSQNAGTLQPDGRLATDASLSVGFDPGVVTDNLCEPSITGGYLGAENQTIRIQLVTANSFTWGFDNAAPLYRVTVAQDRTTVTLETDPKDQEHWPLAGDTVEILPWSAVLSNGEKIAENRGHLSLVSGSYNPDDRQLTLATALPANFGDAWKQRADHAGLGDEFFYLRVWRRGTDRTSNPTVSFTPGTEVDLGHTGLKLTFSGANFRPGDYWIIAARPKTPNAVVPWSLETGRGPNGMRVFVAPLALIQWTSQNGTMTPAVISDCRRRFMPLTQQDTCSTFTVGDDVHSYGNFQRIQDAVDALPTAGGLIHVLPGTYQENVLVHNRHNVTIRGCDDRSHVLAPEGNSDPVFRIRNSRDIVLESMAISSELGVGVQLEQGADLLTRPEAPQAPTREPATPATPTIAQPASRPTLDRLTRGTINLAHSLSVAAPTHEAVTPAATSDTATLIRPLTDVAPLNRLALRPISLVYRNERITLRDLTITVRDRSAVLGRGGGHIALLHSRITVTPLAADLDTDTDTGRWPAVFLAADDVRIHGNSIVTNDSAGARRTALGGVQIAGGSDRVEVTKNEIRGGNGNGITLGSLLWVPQQQRQLAFTNYTQFLRVALQFPTGLAVAVDPRGCVKITLNPPAPTGSDGTPLVPVSEGSLSDVSIVENLVTGTAGNGVSVVHFFDPTTSADCVTVHGLELRLNRILGCLQGEIAETSVSERTYSGFGGVALAAVNEFVAVANRIESNGLSHLDPICGIFLLYAESAVIEQNHIVNNGPRTSSDAAPRAGNRGGVVILMAVPALDAVTTESNRVLGGSSLPAARLSENIVVSPEGRALKLTAAGAVAVENNHLASLGNGGRGAHGNLNTVAVNGRLTNAAVQAGTGISAALLDLLGGAAVSISNLGTPLELRGGGASAGFGSGNLTHGAVARGQASTRDASSGAAAGTSGSQASAGSSATGSDTAAASQGGGTSNQGQADNNVFSGNVLFSGNQVSFESAPADVQPPLSTVLIYSRDDVAIQDNQIEADATPPGWFLNTIAYALTLRVTGNRFKEPLVSAQDHVLSLVSVAQGLNITTGNESTHCVYAHAANSQALVRQNNVTVVELMDGSACAAFSEMSVAFGTREFVARRRQSSTGSTMTSEATNEILKLLN